MAVAHRGVSGYGYWCVGARSHTWPIWSGLAGACHAWPGSARSQRLRRGVRKDRPVVVAYAEAGAYVLHQEAAGARLIDLGVFDNELEIADSLLDV